MTGQELVDLVHPIGFFAINDYPGMILRDKQAWIFEGGSLNPRPITRDELIERGAIPELADTVAEMITSDHPDAIEFLKSAVSEHGRPKS